MSLNKRFLASFILILCTSVDGAEPTTDCAEPVARTPPAAPKIPPAVTKNWPAVRTEERFIQEFSINCGSQTENQTIPLVAPELPKDNQPSSFWIRLIEEFVKLIGVLAWPIAAVVIALFFKKELASLMSRVKKGKWGDAELEFENYVRDVDAEADIPRAPAAETISPEAAVRASTDPRGAILGAWIAVEDALFDLVRSLDLPVSSSSTSQAKNSMAAIRAAQKAQVLDAKWISLFHDLRMLRNEAAHSNHFSPDPESVITYVQLAKELTTAVRTAASNTA